MYITANSGLLRWSARVPNDYLSQLWFVGLVSQGSYCIPQLTGSLGLDSQGSFYIPQLTLVWWGGQPGLLMYTPANSGPLGWSSRVPDVYPSQLWFIGVVSQGSYFIPQPTLVSWGGQPGFLLYTPADWFIGVISQGSYRISKLTLVH